MTLITFAVIVPIIASELNTTISDATIWDVVVDTCARRISIRLDAIPFTVKKGEKAIHDMVR